MPHKWRKRGTKCFICGTFKSFIHHIITQNKINNYKTASSKLTLTNQSSFTVNSMPYIVSKTSPSNNIHFKLLYKENLRKRPFVKLSRVHRRRYSQIQKRNLLEITVASREEKTASKSGFGIAQADDLPFSLYRYIALAQRKFICYFQYRNYLLLHVCNA